MDNRIQKRLGIIFPRFESRCTQAAGTVRKPPLPFAIKLVIWLFVDLLI